MPEEPEKPETETTELSAPAEQAPEPEPKAEPEEVPETIEEGQEPASDEGKRWQAAYTRARQKDRAEVTALQAELAEVKASLPGRPTAADGEPGAAETQVPDAVERILRSSPTIRNLQRAVELARLEGRLEVESAKIPEFPAHSVEFTNWLKTVPGIAQELAARRVSLDAAWNLWPSRPQPRRQAAATKLAAKPVPRVETHSAAGGVVKDIRQDPSFAGRKRISTDEAFGVALKQATREVPLAE